jgi:hypothetical protein
MLTLLLSKNTDYIKHSVIAEMLPFVLGSYVIVIITFLDEKFFKVSQREFFCFSLMSGSGKNDVKIPSHPVQRMTTASKTKGDDFYVSVSVCVFVVAKLEQHFYFQLLFK